jgi:acetyl esterase/lipase
MRKILINFLIVLLCGLSSMAQEYRLPIYSGTIPNSKSNSYVERMDKTDYTSVTNIVNPEIVVFLPKAKIATGQAIVICPGGGYVQEGFDIEGTEIAYYLNSIGVAGIVLKYRLPDTALSPEPHKAPSMDAQRAIRLVRAKASKWNISPNKVGIMGFSAGGHVASTVGTHFDLGNASATDTIEKLSCRPDFMVLAYPVISFTDSIGHKGSRGTLLAGGFETSQWIRYYSNELQIQSNTPPTFLVHAGDDATVSPKNSLYFYQGLLKRGIPSELHILPRGGHGFGMAYDNEQVAQWTNYLKYWLKNL